MRKLLISLVLISLLIVPVLATTNTFYNISYNSAGGLRRAASSPYENWATIKAGVGTSVDKLYPTGNNNATTYTLISATSASSSYSKNFTSLNRYGFCTDTSSIPDGNIIDSVTFSYSQATRHSMGTTPYIIAVNFSPADPTNLQASDFQNVGNTPYSTSTYFSNYATRTITLNDDGETNINKTGTTCIGFKLGTDYSGTQSWVASTTTDYLMYKRTSITGDGWNFFPYLTVIHHDTTEVPPGYVTNLRNTLTSSTATAINWTNPTEENFNHTSIYRNNILMINASNTTNSLYWDDLVPTTSYTVSTQTVNVAGYPNTNWQNITFSAVDAPSITSFTPTTGLTSGGTTVYITGLFFTGTTSVKFGTTTASFSVIDDTNISVLSPAKSAGSYTITVTSPNGTVVSVQQYTYTTAPAYSPVVVGAVHIGVNEENVEYEHFLYGAGGDMVYVFNLTDKSKIKSFVLSDAQYTLSPFTDAKFLSTIHGMVADRGYLYVGTGCGVFVYNISDTANTTPTLTDYYLLGSCSSTTWGDLHIDSSGNYVYDNLYKSAVIIINVTNKSDLSYIGSISGSDTDNRNWVQGDYLYTASVRTAAPDVPELIQFTIFDLTNPASPVKRGHTHATLTSQTSGMWSDNDYLYFAQYKQSVGIIDVQDKDNPSLITIDASTAASGGSTVPAVDIKGSGDKLYVSGRYDIGLGGGLYIFNRSADISLSMDSYPVNQVGIGYINGMEIGEDGNCWIGGDADGIVYYDATGFPAHVSNSLIRMGGHIDSVRTINGKYLVAMDHDSIIWSFDVSDPMNVQLLDKVEPGSVRGTYGFDIDSNNKYGYFPRVMNAGTTGGTPILDFSDPTNIRVANKTFLAGKGTLAEHVALIYDDDSKFITQHQGIWNLSNPVKPTKYIGSLSSPVSGSESVKQPAFFARDGNQYLVSNPDNTINIYNYTDPYNRVLVSSRTQPNKGIAKITQFNDTNNLWTMYKNGYYYLQTYDISNLSEIKFLDQVWFSTSGQTCESVLADDVTKVLYCAGKHPILIAFDGTNPAQISSGNKNGWNSFIGSVHLSGNFVTGTPWLDPSTGRIYYMGKSGILIVNGSKPHPITTPVAKFNAHRTKLYPGDDIKFTDSSWNLPTSWQWSWKNSTTDWTVFSTDEIAHISFDTLGFYDINLTATTTAGSDTLTKLDYIEITYDTEPESADGTFYVLATGMDAQIGRGATGTGATISDLRRGEGTSFSISGDQNNVDTASISTSSGTANGNFSGIGRFGWSVDTSIIEDNATISWAILHYYGAWKMITLGSNIGITITDFEPDDPENLQMSDFNKTQNIVYAGNITAGTFVYPGWNTWTLTNTSAINKTGYTSLFFRTVPDVYNTSEGVVWALSKCSQGASFDYSRGGANRPWLEVSWTVPVSSPPTAAFDMSTDEPLINEQILFTDQSQSNILNWSWDFGDGNTSTDQNPTNTYSLPAEYTVNLTVANEMGYDSELKNITVLFGTEPPDLPKADFIVNRTTVMIPGYVLVNDTSTNFPDTYNWVWGDGSPNSTEQNATHQYTKRGFWNLTLEVENILGVDSQSEQVRVMGYQGLEVPESQCNLSFSRQLTVSEYNEQMCKVCGVC